jgi:two-component system, LuxR family, sensor kinase FixL
MQALTLIAKWLLALVACVLLDYATFTPPLAPLGITPWNPSIGLAVAIVLVGGRRFAPLMALAPFISDLLVRALPFPWWVSALEAVLIGAGYYFGLQALSRPAMTFDRKLHRLRDLLMLAAVMAAAAAVVAIAYCTVLVALGYLDYSRWPESIVRYWVGEMIGLMVMTPFLLLMAYRNDFPAITLEGILQAGAIFASVALVVGLAGQPRLQLSFLLMVPIIWLAVRFGFEGVTAGLLMMQVCLMIALQLGGGALADVTLFQAIMVILAVTGLAIGQLISERAEDERRLRSQQDALARAARLGSMGEFATAVAHEINQPLTAVANYARATLAAVKSDPPRLDDARHAAEKLIEQADRSAQVIRRLREMIRAGRLTIAPEPVDRIVNDSLELVRPSLQRHAVPIDVALTPALPRVAVDLIQIEQVLTNLIRNAVEALEDDRTPNPRITIVARKSVDQTAVEFTVSDNGPGFPTDFDLMANRSLASSKPGGLGVGLALCQSIIEIHGGQMSLKTGAGSAAVSFTVPIAQEVVHA